MKIGHIQKNGRTRLVAVLGKSVVMLKEAYAHFKKDMESPPFPSHLFAHPLLFMEGFPRIKKTIAELLSLTEGATDAPFVVPLSRAKWKAPVPRPGAIYCLARNYADHILEFHEKVVEQDRMVPQIFMKPPTCVTGPGGPVILPGAGVKIDWEAELAVVIGKRAKYVSEENALRYVMGYTCMMDISERALKIRERKEARGRDRFFDWLNGKWMDTFAPQGPWIAVRDEIPDPQNLNISLSVNGEKKQDGNTGQMIFSVAQIISYLSHLVTLMPGDIISTGTPSGVGAPKGTFLKDDDSVEMRIDKVGSLKVRVRGEKK